MKVTRLFAVCTVGILFFGAQDASADTIATLNVGGNFASPYYFTLNGTHYGPDGAGNIQYANLVVGNVTTNLPYMYCVDIMHVIYVPGSYTVTTNGIGYIANDLPAAQSGVQLTPYDVSHPYVLTNAGNIAYLLENYAASAQPIANFQGQIALQAAIWTEVYGSNFSLDLSHYGGLGGTVATLMGQYLNGGLTTGGHSSYTSDVFWINPNNGYQAQVGWNGNPTTHQEPSAPVPGAFVLAGMFFGTLGVGRLGRRWGLLKI